MKKLIKPNFKALPERNDRWMVTFGDLLTLLLCFFLALVTVNGERISRLVAKGNAEPNGTLLATNAQDKRISWLSFSANTLQERGIKGVVEEKIRELESAQQLNITRFFIQSCWPSNFVPEEWSWHQAMNQALTAQGQLVDTIGREISKDVLVRVVGPYCQEMAQVDEDAVLIIGLETA